MGSRPVGSFLAMRHRQYRATMVWKVRAQRAEYSLTENVASPFQAEPRQDNGSGRSRGQRGKGLSAIFSLRQAVGTVRKISAE